MGNPTFEAREHRATTPNRRASLKLLGSAMASALAAQRTPEAEAGVGRQCKKQCRKQGTFCRVQSLEFCNGDAACEDALLPCCAFIEKCNANGFFTCFFAGL